MSNKWLSRLVNDWNTSRVIRLLLGVGLTALGIVYKENIVVFFGVWFTLQGLLNLSCCGGGDCALSGNSKQLYKDDIKMYRPKK